MKTLLLRVSIGLLAGVLASCANEPIVSEFMIIAPDSIVLRAPTQDTTISITHSCSCPFSWTATITPLPDTAWLKFQNYQSGDKTNVPLTIDRARLQTDTNRATIRLASNSYGDTTITVIAIR